MATSVHGLAQGHIAVTANPNFANGTGGALVTQAHISIHQALG
jgi:hypothetical protein